jgi:hypothetical protein
VARGPDGHGQGGILAAWASIGPGGHCRHEIPESRVPAGVDFVDSSGLGVGGDLARTPVGGDPARSTGAAWPDRRSRWARRGQPGQAPAAGAATHRCFDL